MARGRLRESAVRLARRRAPALFCAQIWRRYLTEIGWVRTVRSAVPEDHAGKPLPWFTYAAIEVLAQRTPSDVRVFEYGTGQSTLWWARRAGEVVSVEHDPTWFDTVRHRAPGNVTVMHQPEGQPGYAQAPGLDRFDVIVIDGVDRNECAVVAAQALTSRGIIVWDNSDRSESDQGLALLVDHGFKRLDLSGLGPVNAYGWTTSILYRDGNCLGL